MLVKSLESVPFIFYFGRYKGDFNRSHHFFAIYEVNGVGHWWCEVPERVSTVGDLVERVIAHETLRSAEVNLNLVAAGVIDERVVDFIKINIGHDELKGILAASFSCADNSRFLLYRYANSRILIQSEDTGWGTVENVLEDYGFTIIT